ncbi:MAG: GNAT family N-acetyltransferase [Acidimicrobiia bacterium]
MMTTPLRPRTGLPAGYPFDYERQAELPNGRRIYFRPVVPGDVTLLAEEVAAADVDTLYHRFFNPAIRLDSKRLRFLTEVDYRRRFALVGFVEGEPVAIARFEPSGENLAELAVVVKTGWRRLGIATMMLEILELAAIERGVMGFEAVYLPSNHAVERVLAKRAFGKASVDSGVARVTKNLR